MAVAVDFRPIGINLLLDHTTAEYQAQLITANTLFSDVIPNVARISNNVDATHLKIIKRRIEIQLFNVHTGLNPSYLVVNDKTYYIKNNAIKSGNNGLITIVSENQDLTGVEYILKTVLCRDDTLNFDYEGAIKEAMINHTLYTHNNTITNQIITLASTWLDSQLVVFTVQEKLDSTLYSLIKNPPAGTSPVDTAIQAITQVTAILKSLWTDDLQFNHCDLKPDNIMRGADGNFRLIDFGVSHLKNGMYVCRTPGLDDYNSRLKPTKDLSALIWYMVKHCNPGFVDPIHSFLNDCLLMSGGFNLNRIPTEWSSVLEVVNSRDNTKTDVTTFVLPGATAGGSKKRCTRRRSGSLKKLSKKLTKKNSKHKMKGGLVNSLARPTPTTFTLPSNNKKRAHMDNTLKLHLSTSSVEHLLTYLRFEKGEIDRDTLVKYLTGELMYPGIDRANTATIDPSKDKEQIIDLFLEQTNPEDAQRLLRVLVQFPIHNGNMKYYNNYIEDWNKVKDMETTDLSIKNDLLNFNLYAENTKY